MSEELDKMISEVLAESAKRTQGTEEAKLAADAAQQQRVAFLAEYLLKFRSTIRPTFENVSSQIESARKIGRWSDNVEGAKNELAADVIFDEDSHRAQLWLSRRGILAMLSLHADPSRLQVRLSASYINPATKQQYRDDKAEWLQLAQITDSSLERQVGAFLGEVKKILAAE
jgi:hypothetical protein